ncbi:hypothetical protein NE237_028122 [Protea cynaroides]|uniref:Uncharacterized protein n=1 Tax=Protea cynaroides TaxID=273540 RepID=A0A9Q0JUU5_9MAGN|nr:hypothetical protein NE237_028122 [Protea cynaroides]
MPVSISSSVVFSLYILAFIVVVTFLDFTVCAQVLDWRSNRGFLKWILKKFYQCDYLFMFGKSNSPSYLLLLFNRLVIVKESIREKLTNWCSFSFSSLHFYFFLHLTPYLRGISLSR